MLQKTATNLVFVCIISGLLLAGCGQKDATAIVVQEEVREKVNIVFWDENTGTDRTPYYRVLIKRFEEQNPNIHIEYIGLPKISAKQKIDTAIAVNDLPDVCGVPTSWVADFAAQNVLLDLDTFFDQWDEKNKLSPSIIQSNRDMVLDKRLYQLPNTMNMEILWYRTDWLKEAGIKPPENWNDFFFTVEKMTDKDKKKYGFTIRGGDGAAIQLLRMMFAYSGLTNFWDEDGKCQINHPKHIEFVKKYMSLYKKYTPMSDITNGYKEMIAAFDTGTVAMVQHNIGSYSQHNKFLKPEQYAPVPLPKTVDGRFIQESGNTNGYGIFKTTKHPKEAWRFVSFLCSQASQSYWNQSIGQVPTHLDSLKEPWAKELPHMQLVLQMLSNPNLKFYQPPMYLPEYRSIFDQIGDPGIQAVMTNKKSVEEFLNEWAAAFEKSKKKYDKYVTDKKNS
ncbi:ABC transporter substrate-binding protein [Pelosinus propionicus]|uniref:Multiple sugar transport system substrate-binding protein n=1 Tax=Pelosinus propionicus DSM 13327 TaxID=1123291 RepID=A0A1I4JWD7_9FIRM|nr:sugar ABC transporter substrate-binding protein [Pelosinus propionicus]SFL70416.1 multiple sugar transport system substrate-binding protein [Pelosinus propionicus DSM 13327]